MPLSLHNPGPVLLLEYCEVGRLSEWLKEHAKNVEDVQDDLINFAIMTACGMEFLHQNEVKLSSCDLDTVI